MPKMDMPRQNVLPVGRRSRQRAGRTGGRCLGGQGQPCGAAGSAPPSSRSAAAALYSRALSCAQPLALEGLRRQSPRLLSRPPRVAPNNKWAPSPISLLPLVCQQAFSRAYMYQGASTTQATPGPPVPGPLRLSAPPAPKPHRTCGPAHAAPPASLAPQRVPCSRACASA